MTLANTITMLRILLIPLFIYGAVSGNSPLAFCVFIFAAITDVVDGYVARKMKQVSNLGKILDPLADKLLVVSAIIIFVANGTIWAIWAIIIIAREFIVTSLRLVAIERGIVIAARLWGKIKTVVQIVAIGILLTDYAKIVVPSGITLREISVWIMVIIAIISGIDYIVACRGLIKEDK